MKAQAEALEIAQKALEQAKYAINGREHTGFIDSALAALATVSSDAQPVAISNIERLAFHRHVRDTIGWTEFAKVHTKSSGRAYEEAFFAGFRAANAHDAQAAPAVPRVIRTWHGAACTLDYLLAELRDYSKVMPIAGRAQWAMREAASLIASYAAAPSAPEKSADHA